MNVNTAPVKQIALCGPQSLHLIMTRRLALTLAGLAIALYCAAQDGAITYATYCSGCHGAYLQGLTAPTLITKDWKYGGGHDGIATTIREGAPDTEMIGWEKVLSKEKIEGLVEFILAMQNRAPRKPQPVPAQLTTTDYTIKVDQLVTTGIKTPWGIEFTDPHHALVSERSGGLRWLVDGKLDPIPIKGLPVTYAQWATGGFMDIALDPSYSKNGWVYLSFSRPAKVPADSTVAGMTTIVRGKVKDHQWVDQQTLFQVPDSLNLIKGNRWGGRLLFDKDGMLLFSIGDMAHGEDSQNPARPAGKVFRIRPDGTIPPDNPYVKQPGKLAAIYTLGNRNVQGLALNPETKEVWATEHGPMGGDELNVLHKGLNYGWPVITYGVDYSGAIVSKETKREGMEQPLLLWTPSIAVCPAEFVTGSVFTKWKDNLLVGALAFEEIRRLTISGHSVVNQEVILKGVGRVRDLKIGPDGALYVLINEPDLVLRLTPLK